ncbi:NAD(P)H-quinone oxidoreductase [Nakamurella flavida]|uniref:NAD(P)H-quinone oxidoreductase n=1 Tax=Nakamurella flavida TaxID=363630 RepID=A0A938YKT9_9ACTN|nr:NAD(P)H-quinone oxidoreductase [Nakamurella flavida]MBM9477832.1 NAD(P)H-quinone oxidoreductase [Nakamurella flavida]MDP9779386.1 putative PIG3 family NAD(P)H quinone oxidoreductase [Nakamurella flavida]
MKAVVVTAPSQDGQNPTLSWQDVPDPAIGPGEVLLEVTASAVNRADLMQAQGQYPPPPGASDILGLECSGRIVEIGTDVTGWEIGQDVCALLAGGGYAQRVAVPAAQLLPLPTGVDLLHSAALPEVACTVWSNLVMLGGLRDGQTLLVHGGSSGIGTMAIQVGRALGAVVAVTASRATSLEACRELGAEIGINYRDEDFVEALRAATQGRGADLILDVVGAKYLSRNVSALADGGTIVVIGMQGGRTAELDLGALLAKRGRIAATALRSRPVTGTGSKGDIVDAVTRHLWPLIADGSVRPVVDSVFDAADAQAAHQRVAEGGHVGKVLLRMP